MSKKAEEKQKFTDEQTLTALELCKEGTFENCQKCPYRIGCGDGEFSLEGDALDLINRQKAEIERLKADHIVDVGKKVKAFAERVKQTICDNSYPDFINGKPVNVFKAREGYEAIDDLVEEMTEEATT